MVKISSVNSPKMGDFQPRFCILGLKFEGGGGSWPCCDATGANVLPILGKLSQRSVRYAHDDYHDNDDDDDDTGSVER